MILRILIINDITNYTYNGKYVSQEHFLRAQQIACKAVRRALCGVAYNQNRGKYNLQKILRCGII